MINNELNGIFVEDKYISKLKDRLALYYKQTQKMGDKQAYTYYKEFRDWAINHGYTSDEINRAKRSFNHFSNL